VKGNGALVRLLVAMGFSLSLVGACDSGGSAEGAQELDLAAYERAAAELREPAALITAYLPHLSLPEDKQAYAPKSRPELQEASRHAANEIRHTANLARQRVVSPVSLGLTKPLVDVAVACARPRDDAAVAHCVEVVQDLAAAFEQTAQKGKALGLAAFPLIGEKGTVTEAAKKAIAPFERAVGPGKTEKDYFAKRGDSKVTAGELVMACQASAAEAEAVMRGFDGKNEDLHKVAAIHQQSLIAQCAKLGLADSVTQGIKDCHKEMKKPEPSQECKLACAKAEALLKEGVPAAVFAGVEESYPAECETDED